MIEKIKAAAISAGQAILEIYTHPDTDWQVERKADNSPLTIADRRAHAVIAEALADTPHPLLSEEGAHQPYAERSAWHSLWIVDPLDGTKEFLKRNGEFTVNIALVEDGTPTMGVVYVPARREIYWGTASEGSYKAAVNAAGEVEEAHSISCKSNASALRPFRVVASRSHLSPETQEFIDALRPTHPDLEMVSAGSSLKICLVAEGQADVYPRFAPTMEWDTAAGHAVALAAGCEVVDARTGEPLRYNKDDLHNPYFIVRPQQQ